ncbi:nitroreductase family protein [Mycolicibacterium monacense]|uniref:Nitroreductase n=1 Tax=Mycolicibacterium monacense TaxID=85693 RepID=A0AAD1MZX5_MYCMB|nr:nitroreductase family protein [Mycolicibacterium monacense]MDA4105399.1 nitroreductase [Mycolicibacterium monacense DSM 44395]ORB15753.1 nitroreductase [Mycolicibacterium monacense DSM 44395]QHP88604.1 nitroreductase [Mycolicibacterium monacense DSM 44395]BBZ63968.1 nitroreductase [Mycolicibacterium monacense]
MANPPSDRAAQTQVPIHPDLAARWSPRAFDPAAELTDEQLIALLEAARWAASWGGRQPVRFVVGRRGDPTFEALGAVLRRGNSYAKAASALILVCADEGDDERTARYAVLDAGAAIANLSVEAVSRSLITHPMAGFDVDAARAAFGVPDGVRPLAVVAVGRLGDYAHADEAIVERDSRPRERLPLVDVAFAGAWGRPSL